MSKIKMQKKNDSLKLNSQKGFTLIELIMVIVITSIIASVAAMLILEGAKSYQKEVSYSDIHNQGRLAIERMTREIRSGRQASEVGTTVIGAITGNPTNSLIFTDVTGTTITYSLSGTTLNRTVSGTPSPLANNVTTLQFRHYDNAGNFTTVPANVWLIEIYLITSNAGESLPLRVRVHPRNF